MNLSSHYFILFFLFVQFVLIVSSLAYLVITIMFGEE